MQLVKCNHCGAEQFEKCGFMVIKHDPSCQEMAKLRVEFFENFPYPEPIALKKGEVVKIMEDILQRIKDDDSFSGSVSYDAMAPGLSNDELHFQATYRVGNSQGQSGLRIISGN